MTELAIPGEPVAPGQQMTPRAEWAMHLPDADVPWWAISLLDLDGSVRGAKKRSVMSRVRWHMQMGERTQLRRQVFWDTWGQVIELANTKVAKRPLDDWINEAWEQTDHNTGEGSPFTNMVRDAALSSPNAFCSFINLCDDDGHVFVLKDFHLRTLRAMRGERLACILLPWAHGKSALGSLVVPLMDWAEWQDCTEGRIYLSQSHEKKWIRRLMDQVTNNERLHKLFPWVRKPIKGDAGYGVWGTEGFAIGGRTIGDYSFEPLTAGQGATGNRFHRVGADDWVTSMNAGSNPEQEKLKEYLWTGAMTMPQTSTRLSKHRTKFGTFYLCGTLFSRNDVNFETFNRFTDLGHKALRFDVYRHGHAHNGVLWPEVRGEKWVAEQKRDLGERRFNMRCRNIVGGSTHLTFPPEKVRYAECDGTNGRPAYAWQVVPPGCRTIIGFDPGSGKITKTSKDPALVVFGHRVDHKPVMLRDDRGDHSPEDPEWFHVIEWNRLEGIPFSQQCDFIADRARFYQCPAAIEDNNQQVAYAEYINKVYPGVKVISHTTGLNKRDPKQGVEQFEPLFGNDRMIIHAQGAPQHQLLALREELLSYPGARTDLVMAMWVARYQQQLGEVIDRPVAITRTIPSYVNRYMRKSYAMRPL